MRSKITIITTLFVFVVGIYIYFHNVYESNRVAAPPSNVAENVEENNEKISEVEQEKLKKQEEEKMKMALVEKYIDLKIVDVHNHDASEEKYKRTVNSWNKLHIDQVILFGDVSEPSAVYTDKYSWEAYHKYPERVIPFFSGFDMHSEEGVETVREMLETGYMGLGEIVAASTRSPIVSKVKWKGQHPMDGHMPDIYELSAQYKAPILLHIDPLSGEPILKFKEALSKFPNTTFILAHGNVGFSPASMKVILSDYENVLIDFYAGFTAYDPSSDYEIKDYIPVIEAFPNQFLLGTDSGFGINYNQAVLAIYETIDLLSPSTAEMVAHKNIDALIEAQPITATQIKKIQKLSAEKGSTIAVDQLNKREANALIFTLEQSLD